MKKKKGFTLIELLAIIVILAIIAVITVPIILGIVDEAKKGTAKDSAYGYKDAVNKFYTSQLMNNKDFKMKDKIYTISELSLAGVNVSGSEPEGDSWVEIQDNDVLSGCLQYDDYKVTLIANGNVSSVEKGECTIPLSPKIENICADCIFSLEHVDIQNKNAPQSYVTDYRALNTNFF